MNQLNTIAVVLKSINYGDSDKIYTLFSAELGKISALAKGVRKITSKRAGALDSLNIAKIKLRKSFKAELYTIGEVLLQNSFKNIKKDYGKWLKASYVCELILRHTEAMEDSHKLFQLLNTTLVILDSDAVDDALALVYFQIQFLRLHGYSLQLDDYAQFGINLSADCVMLIQKLEANKMQKTVDTAVIAETESVVKLYMDEHFGDRSKTRELM